MSSPFTAVVIDSDDSSRNSLITQLRSTAGVKVAAFFMEQMEGNAEVRGKFLKVRQPGEPCVAGAGGGGGATSFTYTLSLIR